MSGDYNNANIIKATATQRVIVKNEFPSGQSSHIKELESDQEVFVKRKLKGESQNGSDIWYQDIHDHFIWGGALQLAEELPLDSDSRFVTMSCDDYGAVDSIDDAVCDLAERGLIDSVECFTNGVDTKERVKKLLQANPNIDLGIHLTLSSGKPLNTDSNNDFVENGNFVDIKKHNETIYNQNFFWLEKEVRLQIEKAQQIEQELQAELNLDRRLFTHLSSHYNSHSFFIGIYEIYHEAAHRGNYMIRTPYPDKWYKTMVLRFRINFKIMSKKEVLRIIKQDPLQQFPISFPDYFDTQHYGPLPLQGYNVLQNEFEKEIKAKYKDRRKMISKFVKSGDKHMEMMLHLKSGGKLDLMQSDYDEPNVEKKWKAELSANRLGEEYSGVSIEYFDGRILEYNSIKEHGRTSYIEDSGIDIRYRGYI